MKQKLVPSIDILTETEPLFPRYPIMPQATEETFTFETQYFLSSSFFIHTLINTPTIFLLAMSLYLLPPNDFSCSALAQSVSGIPLAIVEAVIFRGVGANQQYELQVERMSFYDYRRFVLPLLKSFLQKHLQDLFDKDAIEKSDAAGEELLTDLARDAGKNINKDCHNGRQTQGEKKNTMKKRKKENFRKAKESKATDAEKNFQLHQNDDETLSTELGVSGNVDEIERRIVIEERMLEKNLEYQRRIENEAKQKFLNDETRMMSGSIGENASECVSVSEGCNDVRQTQEKKKNKRRKIKITERQRNLRKLMVVSNFSSVRVSGQSFKGDGVEGV